MERIDAILSNRKERLQKIHMMWIDAKVQCYNDKELPEVSSADERSIFLAGPTSRNQIIEYNWRSEAVYYLRKFGFTGWIYVPEPRGEGDPGDFTEVENIYCWESTRLLSATDVIFWIPRDKSELLALNTNLELGIILGRKLEGNLSTLFVGWPKKAERMGLPKHYLNLANSSHFSDLEQLCLTCTGPKA